LWSSGFTTGPAEGSVILFFDPFPFPPERYAVQASVIQSDREIFFLARVVSIVPVRTSSMVIEYRTMGINLVVHF
jgi:hypothetical protein